MTLTSGRYKLESVVAHLERRHDALSVDGVFNVEALDANGATTTAADHVT